MLSLALLLLAGCVTYPGPYEYDDPYYQSSSGYSGAYDDPYYDQQYYGYGSSYGSAYDVRHRYDPWLSLYWGWGSYGYAPYRHGYSGYGYGYGYGYDPFYRPYYGWYGSGYYWRPYVHRRDDRDDYRRPRQAARDFRSGAGVPSTYSSRPAGRGPSYQGQTYGRGTYRGQSSSPAASQGASGLRGTVRSLDRSGDSRRAPTSYGRPASRPSSSARDALRATPPRPTQRERSSNNIPSRPSYRIDRGSDSSTPYRRSGQRSRDALRQSTPSARPAYPANVQQRGRSTQSARPPGSNYRAPAAAPRARSTAPVSAPARPAASPSSRSDSGGRSTQAVRGRGRQND
jgi:hypothetical protein